MAKGKEQLLSLATRDDPNLTSYRISPNMDSIPGWQIGGEGHVPQIVRSCSVTFNKTMLILP